MSGVEKLSLEQGMGLGDLGGTESFDVANDANHSENHLGSTLEGIAIVLVRGSDLDLTLIVGNQVGIGTRSLCFVLLGGQGNDEPLGEMGGNLLLDLDGIMTVSVLYVNFSTDSISNGTTDGRSLKTKSAIFSRY